MSTSARLLALLGVLSSRSQWSATDLAERFGVGERTIRGDVTRLRGLGYPVEAVRGPGGGYRFGTGSRLPPLLVDQEEAVAIAVGLGAVGATPGLAEAAASAAAKLEHLLPDAARLRVAAVRDNLDIGPANTGSNVADPAVDAALLAAVGGAIRDREALRFFYGEDEQRVEAEPHRLVSWQQRWYLVARVRPSRAWRVFRVDWMTLRTPGAGRFVPEPMASGAYAEFVLREVASTGWAVHARVRVDAPAEEVLARINPAVGTVESIDATHSVLVTGADSLEIVAVWIGMLGLDFHVDEPPDLVAHVAALAARYRRALPG